MSGRFGRLAQDGFAVQIVRAGQSKFSKNPVGGKPHTFETREEAQALADRLRRDQTAKSAFEKGKAEYRVVEV
jgi:hypothetical protein